MRRLPTVAGVSLVAALLAIPSAARADVSVAVDPANDAHVISPLVYGMNFATDAQIAQGRIPFTRWGGDSTTRYNWQIDVTNLGSDWYFENVAGCLDSPSGCNPPPADPKTNSGANAFLARAKQGGIATFFTVPAMGWIAKPPPKYAHPFDCGCPGIGDKSDPYDTNCHDGISGGQPVACPDPSTTTSIAAGAQWVHDWVAYLVARNGPSNGSVIYQIDNEPNLWPFTHHDAHPKLTSYDELWQKLRDTAVAILDADPTALVAGPAEWGWPNYFCSAADDISKGCSPQSPDRAAHGGEELMAWLLDQAAAYEKQSGKRILHYLDLHYYPQGGAPPETTRSLWDDTYVDPSWINAKIRLVPRMRDWVAQHYPGTRISISEYDWAHHTEDVGAVATAEVLGIFGREGVDAATAWSPPKETDAAFGAYALYRNYDGQGGSFESVSVRTTVSGSAFAAYGAAGAKRLTVALVNEAAQAQAARLTFGNFAPKGSAQLWMRTTGVTIAKQADVVIANGAASVTMPASSIAMLVVEGDNPNALPDAGTDAAAPDAGDDSGAGTEAGTDGNADAGGGGGCGCRAAGGRDGGVIAVLFVIAAAGATRARASARARRW